MYSKQIRLQVLPKLFGSDNVMKIHRMTCALYRWRYIKSYISISCIVLLDVKVWLHVQYDEINVAIK